MESLARHWPEYLIETACLGLFMVSAAGFATLLQHPASPIAVWHLGPASSRLAMGLAMGLTAMCIIYSPLGKRSGAHMNPAVTMAFLRLGKIRPPDAIGYVLAQFVGGTAGILVATILFRGLPSDPSVNYVATLPGRAGQVPAFIAEACISFLMMSMVLVVSNRARVAHLTGIGAGLLVAAFILFEAPFSGMSMNPARTLGSNVLADAARTLWIYFAAPPLGMLLASEIYLRRHGPSHVRCAKLHHTVDVRCIFRCGYGGRLDREEGRGKRDEGKGKREKGKGERSVEIGGPGQREARRLGMSNHYDVIIIGTGAGGGTLAYHLAPSGKRILLLERGDYVRREKDNWSSHAVNVEAKYHTREVWQDKEGKPLHPHTNYYVGGNTKFYGAALFRLREQDFSRLVHHGGTSPAWPVTYDEMEPYYTKAEHLYQVHGERGVDPTEPRASSPYRFPAVQHEPRIQQLHDDLVRCGLKPFHVPLGIMLDEKDSQRSRCIRCDTCDGFPCLVHAKSDAQVICVDPALEHSNVSLLTNAKVTRLETSASGREISRVVVDRGGESLQFSGDIVVSSCGAINSAALLLRSANHRHPNGLANRSGVVGRHYMGHVNSVLLAISKTPNSTVFQKTLAVNDFYFGEDEFRYPMGHISFVGKLDAIALSAGAPSFVPGMTLDVMAKHSLDFWLTSEDLPDPDNRVTLDRNGSIVLSYTPNNGEGHRRLIERLKSLMQHLDMQPHLIPRNLFVGNRIPLAGVAHQNGTIRFGRDPETSALDPTCRAHEVDNLYVVDGSFFPSSGAVNPALTIMANALRVGDHILERLGARTSAQTEVSA